MRTRIPPFQPFQILHFLAHRNRLFPRVFSYLAENRPRVLPRGPVRRGAGGAPIDAEWRKIRPGKTRKHGDRAFLPGWPPLARIYRGSVFARALTGAKSRPGKQLADFS